LGERLSDMISISEAPRPWIKIVVAIYTDLEPLGWIKKGVTFAGHGFETVPLLSGAAWRLGLGVMDVIEIMRSLLNR
jgi:hypothetical protein